MSEFSSANKKQLVEAQGSIHNQASSVGVSYVTDYIVLRRAMMMEQLLAAPNYDVVCRIQGAVEELDEQLRIIRQGPHKIPQ